MVTAQMKLRVKNGPKYFKINLFYDAIFLYTLKELCNQKQTTQPEPKYFRLHTYLSLAEIHSTCYWGFK